MSGSLDHRSLINSMTPELRKDLCQQSDKHGLLRAALHLGLIGLMGWYIAVGGPLWQVLLVPQGVLIVFLFTALHETIHLTAFRTDALNRAMSMLCGFLVFLAPTHFRYFHLAHHRFTQDPDHDPELARAKPGTMGAYLWYLSGLSDWRWRSATFLRNALTENRDPYVPRRARGRVRWEARAFLAAYAAVFGLFGATLLWVWLVPMLLGGPFLRGYLLAEHARCPHVANMLANTRTTFTNRLVRWIAWNMPFHAEHHAYPAVPFHRLPQLHRIMREHLQSTAPGYGAFHAGYAQAVTAGSLTETKGRG